MKKQAKKQAKKFKISDGTTEIVPQFINMMVVKIGDRDRPAGVEDIHDMQEQIKECLTEGGNPVLITHHAVKFETIQIPCETGTIIVVGGMKDENQFSATTPILVNGVPGVAIRSKKKP